MKILLSNFKVFPAPDYISPLRERMRIKKGIFVRFITIITALTLVILPPAVSVAAAQTAPSSPTAPAAPAAATYDINPPDSPDAPETPTVPDSPSQETQSLDTESYSGEDYSGIEAVNQGNGADSFNTSNVESSQESTIDVSNTAAVQNNLELEASTGDNSASGNTGGTSQVQTGDATLGVAVAIDLNITAVSQSGCCSQSVGAVNSGNGSNSTNSANSSTTTQNSITIDNDAQIATEIVAASVTGDNDASRNVGDSVILTGDANLSATIITDANTTALGVYQFDVNDNQTGDIVLAENLGNCINCGVGVVTATNSGNGSNSTNTSTSSASTTSTETITNESDVVNNITLTANSGDNTADRNTGGDSTVVTGDANVAAAVVNVLNTVVSGVIYTVNIFGDLVGNIVLAEENYSSSCGNCCDLGLTAVNSDNGADSQNEATATSTNTQEINQTNNATINNNLNLAANTGDNDTSRNTGGDSVIETGEVSVAANSLNVANLNVAGSACDEPVYLVLVNDLGGWDGQILGAADGAYYYGSDGIVFILGPNGEIIATNSANGAGSVNSATVTSTSTTDVTQTNTASVTNNINIVANTGNNSTSRNTDGVNQIKTGDANVVVNLVNFINSNFSGRKIVLTLVNVFGSWLGNFITPGASLAQDETGQGSTQENSNPNSQNSSTGARQSQQNNQHPLKPSGNSNSQASAGNQTGKKSDQKVLSTSVVTSNQSGQDGVETFTTASENKFSLLWLTLVLLIPAAFLLRKLAARFG